MALPNLGIPQASMFTYYNSMRLCSHSHIHRSICFLLLFNHVPLMSLLCKALQECHHLTYFKTISTPRPINIREFSLFFSQWKSMLKNERIIFKHVLLFYHLLEKDLSPAYHSSLANLCLFPSYILE